MNYILGMRTDTIVSLFGMAITWQAYLLIILSWGFSSSLTIWALGYVYRFIRPKWQRDND